MPNISFSYSIPYLVFFLFLFVLLLFEFRNLKSGTDIKYIRWATIVGFVFFFGLRGFVFSDWGLYYPFFEKMPTIWEGGFSQVMDPEFAKNFATDVSTGKSGLEMGFVYFTLIIKSIIPDYYAWVFINCILDVILLDLFFRKYSPYYVLSFILFITFGGLIIECNLMRNFKAILFFLISIKYLQERRIIPYFLLNFAGILFHSSAILYLPLYFILHKECPKWLMWVILIAGIMVSIIQISYLRPIALAIGDFVGGRLSVQIRLYFASDFFTQSYGLSIGFIERIITYLCLILFKKKLIERNPYNNIFINVFILYFIFFFYFTEVMIVAERMTLLFAFSYWILYAELLALVKEIANKTLVLTAILAFSILKIVSATNNVFSKYDNLLFGIESYDERSQIFYNDLDNYLDSKGR